MKTRLSLIAVSLAIAALVTAAPASATPTVTTSWEPTPISTDVCVMSLRPVGDFGSLTCGALLQP